MLSGLFAPRAPGAQPGPRKAGWVGWLAFALLGLLAAGAGAVLPRQGAAPPPAAEGEAAPAATPGPPASLDYSPAPMPDLPSARAMLVRLALGTVAVLALCVLTLWVGKRWLRPLAVRDGAGKELRVIEALPLSGRCSVYLIQAGKCRALAGVDASGLKALLTLTEPFEEALAEGKADEPPAGPEAAPALPKAA